VSRPTAGLAGVAALGLCLAAPVPAAPAVSGQLRAEALAPRVADAGPLAAAAALDSDRSDLPRSSQALQGEWRLAGHGLTAVATLRQQRPYGGGASKAWFNELQASGGSDNWQFSAGRKIVGWDVGYAWRPNDVVQQEARRTLLSTTPAGRPLLMAEHYTADVAWSAVWVNPGASRQRRGGSEPALALRAYRQAGAVDWHGFARWGVRTRGSLGAAAAWVASDALELHASARWVDDTDVLAPAAGSDAAAGTLLTRSPWQPAQARRAGQWLVGGTWTHASQLSLLAEAWWDGTAPSPDQWRKWRGRNLALASLAGTPAPMAAVAGNLRWQADAFGAAGNLQRANLYARASWTRDAWKPELDVLLHPSDRGALWTAALGWQGDRWRLDTGWRQAAGPARSVLMRLPTRRMAWLAATWAF
jgi:hypothetical protein